MDTKEFFQSVYGKGSGRVVIVLPNHVGKPTQDNWFSYPEDLDAMAAFADSKKTVDVWYSPVIFKSDSRTKDNSKQISVFAADADACDPNNFRAQPSLTVQTSDDRWQVYWFIKTPQNAHDIAKINRRIAQVHKHQGCDIAFVNAAKLLRVPGSSNSKHPGAVVIVADFEEGSAGNVSAMEKLYPQSEVPDAIDVEQTPVPEGIETYIAENRNKLMNGLPNGISLRNMLFGKFQSDKRSDVRYRLLCELYRIGLDDNGVMAVAWGAPSNKYNGEDPRGVAGLWAEAMKAKKEVELESELDEYDRPIDSPGQGGTKPDTKQTGKLATDFLDAAERESLKEFVNFIDEWVHWAGTKTDAPSEYHRAAAMMIMSAVYSEFGHATPKFAKGGLKLNIWFMVLGRSTKDRKSTSRHYAEAMFRALKTDEYNYSIGDDVTPGGISLALHSRANKSTVFSRDEVQGLFKELLNQSYMSGGLEVFTKLYDGWSGGRVRASGDKKEQESVPVSFIMFLMGILTESADVLTVTNYRSGFLTRFNYIIGKRPDGYKAPPIEQSSPEEQQEDLVFNSMVKHLAINRNHWEMLGGDGKTFGLRAEDDAWVRFQQFERDVQSEVENTQYAEIIGTTAERMVISTLKLATILAMDDRSNTVKMKHILQAIGYAGEWFDNAVTVASMVSESEWMRDVEKLEEFINSKGGKVSYAAAYRNFSNKRPFEFEEMLQSLESRGTLNRVQSGSRWILETVYEE